MAEVASRRRCIKQSSCHFYPAVSIKNLSVSSQSKHLILKATFHKASAPSPPSSAWQWHWLTARQPPTPNKSVCANISFLATMSPSLSCLRAWTINKPGGVGVGIWNRKTLSNIFRERQRASYLSHIMYYGNRAYLWVEKPAEFVAHSHNMMSNRR